MRALLTGASSFTGRHLEAFLGSQGVEVHSVSRKPSKHARWHQISHFNQAAIREVLQTINPSFIFHLVGAASGDDVREFYRANVETAAVLFEAIKALKLSSCTVLIVGSAAEYGHLTTDGKLTESLVPKPITHYGISKFAQTLLAQSAREQGLSVVTARVFNAIGPGMPPHLALQSFSTQLRKILKGESPPVIKVGNLDSKRDFIDVRDLVEIYWRLANAPSARGEIFNVCTGTATKIGDALEELIQAFGLRVRIEVDPMKVRKSESRTSIGDNRKLMSLLPEVSFRPLRQTLVDIAEAMKSEHSS